MPAPAFRFGPPRAPAEADRIFDFDATEGDRLLLEGLGLPTGPLDPAAFAANLSGQAGSAATRLTDETDAGRLWFDPDGNGAAARQIVVTLTGAPALTAAEDLLV